MPAARLYKKNESEIDAQSKIHILSFLKNK